MVDYVIKVAKNVSLWSWRANWLGTLDATVPLIQANFGQFSSSREEANKDMVVICIGGAYTWTFIAAKMIKSWDYSLMFKIFISD